MDHWAFSSHLQSSHQFLSRLVHLASCGLRPLPVSSSLPPLFLAPTGLGRSPRTRFTRFITTPGMKFHHLVAEADRSKLREFLKPLDGIHRLSRWREERVSFYTAWCPNVCPNVYLKFNRLKGDATCCHAICRCLRSALGSTLTH